MTAVTSNAPAVAGWNLGLRFGLELAALTALGVAGWQLATGPARPLAAIGLPVIAAVLWGTFNVAGDPSRSGAAPVAVSGWTRLAIELAILLAGAVAILLAGRPSLALLYSTTIVLHYATTLDRIVWLIDQ